MPSTKTSPMVLSDSEYICQMTLVANAEDLKACGLLGSFSSPIDFDQWVSVELQFIICSVLYCVYFPNRVMLLFLTS